MDGAARFRVRPGPPLEMHVWDDRAVVFDPRSGDTHVIDVVAAAALKHLADSPRTRHDLTTHLAATLEFGDASLGTYLDELLSRLTGLGVIEDADSCA